MPGAPASCRYKQRKQYETYKKNGTVPFLQGHPPVNRIEFSSLYDYFAGDTVL